MPNPQRSLSISRYIVLVSYFGLLLSLTLNTIWLSPPESVPIALLLIFYVGPLLFPLKGILAGVTRTHIYASFIALFYFAHAIVMFVDPKQFIAAILQLIFSLVFFIICLVYTRLRHKNNATKTN